MDIFVRFVVEALIFLTLGVFVGYFAYKNKKLEAKIDRVAAVLAQAGPDIAARIQDGGTRVKISDEWHEELDEQVVTR